MPWTKRRIHVYCEINVNTTAKGAISMTEMYQTEQDSESTFYQQLGTQLTRERKKAGLTQRKVADMMGTTASAVARLESVNKIHSPSLNTLRRYAAAINCQLKIELQSVQVIEPEHRVNVVHEELAEA